MLRIVMVIGSIRLELSIQSIDNPGWSLKVNITDTDIEGRTTDLQSIDDDSDWFIVNSDGETFKGYGDPTKLAFLLNKFAEFVKS